MMKLKWLLQVLLVASSMLAAMVFSLWQVQQVGLAQGSDVIVDKQLNNPSNVVRVGDILSFTITVDNQSAFTLTQVRLVDTFDDNILQFLGADPTESSVVGSTLTWDNIAILLNPGGMVPGETQTFTVSFRAIRPDTAIVNRVEGRDIIRENGANGTSSNDEDGSLGAGGAKTILQKELSPPDQVPQAGMSVTFTHILTNDSGAFLMRLPLTDTYNPDFLEFNYGLPPPDVITPPGTLVWTNLASVTYFGPITPDTSVVITTVFTAITQVVTTVNRAETGGAIDEFGNDATGDEDEVSITVVDPEPTLTPTSFPKTENDDDDDDNTSRPVPTATSVSILPLPTATATAQQLVTQTLTDDVETPRYLPTTGYIQPQRMKLVLLRLAIGCVFLVSMWLIISTSEKET